MMTRKSYALALYEQGFSSRETARLAGLSSSYVRSLVRDAGIARAPGRPPSRFEPLEIAA
jgi:DNA-binding CsgD family transcriptional regulator